MSGKQILNVGISSPEESLAHFAKAWKDAAGKVFVQWDEIEVNMPLARAA